MTSIASSTTSTIGSKVATTAANVASAARSQNASILQKVLRLPSHLHAAAVAKGQLLPDPHQRALLPRLDTLVSSLPPHDERMRRHGDTLRMLEVARAAEEKRERCRENRPFLHRLRRYAKGVSPHRPTHALPNAYFRLPEPPLAPEPPRGLYLHGDVGCGKSLLMDMTFSCAKPIVASAARVHYHAFMMSVYEMLHRYDILSDAERQQRAFHHPLDAVVGRLGRSNVSSSGAGLLCFDEFQVADVADARLMHGIFDRLMRSGTIVCFTANRPPGDVNRSQLRDVDFVPFLDLIHERCEMHLVASGVDYREVLSGREGQGTANSEGFRTYFDASEEDAVRELWKEETGDDWNDISETVLRVAYGRELVVRRAHPSKRFVQMTVEELIEAPVGAADYRALTREAKAVFLTDALPVFSTDTRNLARRFITFIDVCYEQKARLIMRMEAPSLDEMFSGVDAQELAKVNAAAIAEGLQFESEIAKEGVGADNRAVSTASLYTGEDEVFAFRRAISRLKEMGTPSYGKRLDVF